MASQADRREPTAKGYHTGSLRGGKSVLTGFVNGPGCQRLVPEESGRQAAAIPAAERWLGKATFRAQEVFGLFERALQVGGGLDPAESGADAHKGVGMVAEMPGRITFGS